MRFLFRNVVNLSTPALATNEIKIVGETFTVS